MSLNSFKKELKNYIVANFGHESVYSNLAGDIVINSLGLKIRHQNISAEEAVVSYLETSKYNQGENQFIIATLRGEIEDRKKAPLASGEDRLYFRENL